MKVHISKNEKDEIIAFAKIGNISNSIEIEVTEEELKLLEDKNCKLVNNKIVEIERPEKENSISLQDKLNAQLLKEEAELKKEVQEQKTLNAQVLKEIAKLKGGAV